MNPIHKAIDLSKLSLQFGGPFGAVVMRGDEIVGKGFNLVTVKHDPTAHAEIVAIRQACRFLKTHDLTGCILYTSCEPCPMCLGAIYWAKLDKVFYAATCSDAAEAGFADIEIRRQLALSPEAQQIELIQVPEPERIAARIILDVWKTTSIL